MRANVHCDSPIVDSMDSLIASYSLAFLKHSKAANLSTPWISLLTETQVPAAAAEAEAVPPR